MAGKFSQVFERDKHRCIYCGKYMLLDFETFQTSQLDHLVPGAGDDLSNLVLSCFVCNNLKGKHVPPGVDPSADRVAYIQQVRAHVMSERANKMQDFASWTHPA
ncbi:HNH endonuclease [Lysobacter sp. SG-8]|uniref:HNH endonuclease n=1 Tax=Marilutibacter penaei TaxID=2759900 RepID=A0A7W3YFT5_9GAMM|nr:HNH endonuclease [Lysobacter penaei]